MDLWMVFAATSTIPRRATIPQDLRDKRKFDKKVTEDISRQLNSARDRNTFQLESSRWRTP